MDLGTGIFLSSIVLAVVILYGITKDRWRWRRIITHIALAFAAIVVLTGTLFGGLYFWNHFPIPLGRQIEYAGLRLGMSPQDVLYIKGYPSGVADEPSGVVDEAPKQNPFAAYISTDKLKPGKSVDDYRQWWYERSHDGSISVTFNPEKTAVIAIECLSLDLIGRCPSLAQVFHGDSEQEVIRKLGPPDASRFEGVLKSLSYRTLGIELTLETERVIKLSINDPKYEPFKIQVESQ